MQTWAIAVKTLKSFWGNVIALECSLDFGGKILQEMCFWEVVCVQKLYCTQLQLSFKPALSMNYIFLPLLPAYYLIPH